MNNQMILFILILSAAVTLGLPFLIKADRRKETTPVFKILLAIFLLIAFILPWISGKGVFNDYNFKGYEIPTLFKITYDSYGQITNTERLTLLLVYVLYLLPVCSIAIIILGIYRRNREVILPVSIIGCISVLLGIIAVGVKNMDDGSQVIANLDIGFYGTVVAGFCLWVSVFFIDTSESDTLKVTSEKVVEKDISSKKERLLSQLSTLQTLREKKVITEELFEREQGKLLNQLNNE